MEKSAYSIITRRVYIYHVKISGWPPKGFAAKHKLLYLSANKVSQYTANLQNLSIKDTSSNAHCPYSVHTFELNGTGSATCSYIVK